VSFRSYLRQEIQRRSIFLRLASAAQRDDGEMIDRETAHRIASEQIAEERKRSKAAKPPVAIGAEGITVANSRQVFLARIATLAANIAATAGIVPSTPSAPVIRKHTQDPGLELRRSSAETLVSAPINKQSEPPADQVIGIISNRTTTYQLIDDREFHTSVQSPVTQAWHRSIELNERIAEEREQRKRERMIG
jgi:hypothetical protein